MAVLGWRTLCCIESSYTLTGSRISEHPEPGVEVGLNAALSNLPKHSSCDQKRPLKPAWWSLSRVLASIGSVTETLGLQANRHQHKRM
jgi:hypothetical protein